MNKHKKERIKVYGRKRGINIDGDLVRFRDGKIYYVNIKRDAVYATGERWKPSFFKSIKLYFNRMFIHVYYFIYTVKWHKTHRHPVFLYKNPASFSKWFEEVGVILVTWDGK